MNQQQLLDALQVGAALGDGPVERIDTHISAIFLAGDHAYKVKKAVDLGFVDFTGLDSRRHACEEELRLNARLAPEVYLRVATLTGTPERPQLDGDRPVLDYAVVMRRFPQTALLSRMLAAGTLTRAHIAELAGLLADFHGRIPAAVPDSGYGSATAVWRPVAENLETLPRLLPEDRPRLQALRAWSEASAERLAPAMAERLAGGRVRECHGDLHLENIIYWRGRIMAFDGIEFDPWLRWIDVANELAFVTMDLDDRGASALSWQLRNDYLEATEDYDALQLLGFYQVYRALVRAKVNALQLGQKDGQDSTLRRRARKYLALAEGYTRPSSPALVLMHGVSGTGKSTLTRVLIEQRGFVRLRSDTVRKRLFGLRPEQSSHDAGLNIYTAEASRRTYRRMAELAETVLRAGYSVVLDATFLRHAHRAPFVDLAKNLGLPWHIVSLRGKPELLRQRIQERQRLGGDVSEADTRVLDSQLAEQEPLSAAEQAHATVLWVDELPENWQQSVPG